MGSTRRAGVPHARPGGVLERLAERASLARGRGGAGASPGNARALLGAERTALNFAQRLSGVATLPRATSSGGGTGARSSTRERRRRGSACSRRPRCSRAAARTTASACSGDPDQGQPHRRLRRGARGGRRRARRVRPALEVEVTNLGELDEALAAGAASCCSTTWTSRRGRAAVARTAAARRRGVRRHDARHGSARAETGATSSRRGADALGPGRRPVPHIGATLMSLPMVQTPSANVGPLMLENIPALQAEVRELAAEAAPSSSRTTTSGPRSRTSATTSATRSGSRAGRRDRRRRHRLLRRALHGRDGQGPLPEKTVLIPDLDAGCSLADSITAEQLRGWKAAPRRDRRHLRQQLGRGEGGVRHLLHLRQRGRGGGAHLPRARRGRGDPVRARHVPRRLRREAPQAVRCMCGTASATCRRARGTRRPTRASGGPCASRRRRRGTCPARTGSPSSSPCSR